MALSTLTLSALSPPPFPLNALLQFFGGGAGRLCCCCLVSSHVPLLGELMACHPQGSSVHGVSQAGILEWLPFPSPGDLPHSGIRSHLSCSGRQVLYH